MRINILRSPCVTLILLTAGVANAAAQALPPDGDSGNEKSYSWGLGLAGMAMQKPYTDIDLDSMIIPVIYLESRWVQLIGSALEFKLPGISFNDENVLSFGARVEFDGGGYKESDAPILNGMARRKNGILVGGAARWEMPQLSVSADVMFDANSASKGSRMSLEVERMFFVGGQMMITPGFSASLLDRKYTNYYYGVSPTEVRIDREIYEPGSTFNLSAGLRGDYIFGVHHALFIQAEYTALGSEIKNSPLTDRSGDSMLFLGYLYRF